MTSALYVGRVMHKRLRPFRHRFAYRVYSLLLDLDEIGALTARLRLLSRNRFNLLTFADGDHGPRDGSPLRPWVETQLARHGIDLGGGPIRLLCFPRVLGYVFNPLSIYFCHAPDGRLGAILYEVRNTFGEQHCYILDVPDTGTPITQSCAKDFYVSPFIPMAATYRFRIREPDDHLSILIREAVPEGELLIATLTGRREPLTDAALARAFLTHPLMTLKVVVAIHWEALRLWLKGARLFPRPSTPEKSRWAR